ncbi:MAG: hypothetical protein WD009_00320 [Phycisphaeraceae bacterium]
MRKLEHAVDYSGRQLTMGDTVSTLNGYLTARICDIAADDGAAFVRLRPAHQPYGRGTWHAADRVVWVAAGNRRPRRSRNGEAASTASASASTNGEASA